jgi:hypothetical protein
MSVLINASTSTGLVQSADTSGEIELQSNGTTALKVNTNEGIQILNCLGVGNTTPSTSGAGITFPATQSASSDANTLDDYEEGTWTPIPASSSGSITAYTSSGIYVKVGRTVTITGTFLLSIPGTASGSVTVTGIPFSGTKPSTAFRTAMGSGREDGATGIFYQAVLGGTFNQILLQTAAGVNITWTTNYDYVFTVTYQASA